MGIEEYSATEELNEIVPGPADKRVVQIAPGTHSELGDDEQVAIQRIMSHLRQHNDALATVATSGDYDDLTNKPTADSFEVTRDDLTGPTLALPAIHIKQKSRDWFSAMEAVDTNTHRDEIRNHDDATVTYDCAGFLNEAMDYADRRGYGSVLIPDGLWLLDGTRAAEYDAILFAKSGLTLIGNGYGTHLKVADDYTDDGDYRVLAPEIEEEITDFHIRGLRFDGNAANNLVAGSTGGDIRRAYSVNLPFGCKRVSVKDCFFENNPGRNVLNFSKVSANPIPCEDVVVIGNMFANVGGAISGNENQNDHSSIYCQSERAIVAFNKFKNDNTSFNPKSSPASAVVALEIHGANSLVQGNIAYNYGTLGNCVASVHDAINNKWIGNKGYRILNNGLTLWTYGNFENKNLTIRGNTIEMYQETVDSVLAGGSAIYQNPSATITTKPLEGLVIEDNTLYGTSETGVNLTTHAINLVSAKDARIARNHIYNVQGCGINLEPATNAIGFDNVDIVDNHVENAGIHTSASRVYAIRVANTETDREFRSIRIDRNILKKKLEDVGTAPNGMRGILIDGPGLLRDLTVGNLNEYPNIHLGQEVVFSNTTNFIGVKRVPRYHQEATGSFPALGFFEIGVDFIQHSDAGQSFPILRSVSTSGAGYGSQWSSSTAVKAGQWVRLTGGSSPHIIEYTSDGTTGTTVPNPSVIGQQYTDGTATYVYRYNTPAVFRYFGENQDLSVVATDADFTLTPGTSYRVTRHKGALTADRTITLSTTGAFNGLTFKVTRTGGGAFNLSVGGLKNLATNTWCEVTYEGGVGWYLSAYGSL